MTLAEWERQREEERKKREREEMNERIRKRKLAKLEQQWAAEREARVQEYILTDRENRYDEKMNRVEQEQTAQWNAVQQRKKEEHDHQNEVDAARWAGIAAIEQAKQKEEENKSWFEKTWDDIKVLFNKEIVKPVQDTWNQLIYRPVIQPITHWWKEELPVWIKEGAISLIPIVGDGWGLVRQATHFIKKEPVDELDVILSVVGLVFDLPWPQEGVIGGDVTIAALKGLNAAIPSGPARDVMTQLIKSGLKNPEELARIAKTSEALLKNDRLLKILIDNPEALEAVMRYGPEAIEVLERYPTDEVASFLVNYGDDGMKRVLKYKDMPKGLADEAFPLGFKNVDEFETFGDAVRNDLSEAGYNDVELYMTGSSVSGASYPRPGRPSLPFDSVERGVSDYDIGIVSDELWEKATKLGLNVKNSPPVRIGPLDLKSKHGQEILKELGLLDLIENMDTLAGRDTGFMIYKSAEDFLNNRGPAIEFPGN